MAVEILHGDCRDILSLVVPDESIQSCITSPPYFGLRDYGVEGQIGLEQTPGAYVEQLVEVFREVRRVLRPDGTLWLNLGDSYLNKNRLLIPARVALALQQDGWFLRDDIIWHKPNPMPAPVTDRCVSAHEYIFLLAKSERYYFDHEAIREPSVDVEKSAKRYQKPFTTNRLDEATGHLSVVSPNGMREFDGKRNKRSVWTVTNKPFKGAHFATFPPDLIEPCILAGSSARGCCAACSAPWRRVVESKSISRDALPKGHSEYRPRRYDEGKAGDPQAPGPGQRFRVSRTLGWEPTCSCNADVVPSTILDPFGGAGTTALVARQHGRNALLLELNADYIDIARKRLEAA